jgi:hypothetical protein
MAARMVNSTINSFWRGGPLNWVTFACLKSFVTHGHRLRLFSYENIPNVPKGIEVADARLVVPEERIFLFEGLGAPLQQGSIGPFSDLFRYTLIEKGLGIWVDTDIYCVKLFDFPRPILCAWENANSVGTAVFRFPRESLMIRDMIEMMTPPFDFPYWLEDGLKAKVVENLDGRPFGPGRLTYAAYGPNSVTKLVHKFGLVEKVYDQDLFYPIHFKETELTLAPQEELWDRVTDQTYGIHLWYSQLKRITGKDLPSGSFLSRLRKEANA